MSSLSVTENTQTISLEELPVELLSQLLDYLDAETIFFSVRTLSRFFQTLVYNFQRFVLDFRSISKKNFHVLCRFIDPTNVISLTLSDQPISGQIKLFCTLMNLQQFTRLRSLTLISIDEKEFHLIFEHTNINSIISLSLKEGQSNARSKNKTMTLVSSVLAQARLCRLELNLTDDKIHILLWPSHCTIEHLTIHNVNLNDVTGILSNCPCLRKVTITDYLNAPGEKPINECFKQLQSLSIDGFSLIFERLEFFGCFFPSLKYLKLIGEESILDGERWEELIETNFRQLDHFEFIFRSHRSNTPTVEQLQTIIASFQRPFWLQLKQWFVLCRYNRTKSTIDLHSIPMCRSVFYLNENFSEQLYFSTSTESDASMMKSVTSLDLNMRNRDDSEEKISRTGPLFSQATELGLYFNFWNSFPSMIYFSSLVDISKITRLKLYSSCFDSGNVQGLIHVLQLFDEQKNLSSLTIDSIDGKSGLSLYLNRICQKLPIYIKHLSMLILTPDQAKMIFFRCTWLSTIEFQLLNICFRSDIMKCLEQNTLYSTFSVRDRAIDMWVGKRLLYVKELRFKNTSQSIE